MIGHLKLGSAAFAAFVLAACASSPDPSVYGDAGDDSYASGVTTTPNAPTAVASRVIYSDRTIAGGADYLGDYSTVYGAIGAAGLAPVFDGTDAYTVFAPDNAAFDGMDLSGLSRKQLAETLKYHTVKGRISSADLAEKLRRNNGTYTVTTLSGETLRFIDMDGTIKIADRNGFTYTVDAPDNEFKNGYVHGINGVLGRTY